jgi:integrase
MAVERKEKKDYKYFLAIIKASGKDMSAVELIKLRRDVLKSDLSATEKKSLDDGHIGPLLTAITIQKDRGITEANIWISSFLEKGIIDDKLATLLKEYLTVSAPTKIYSSGSVFCHSVVPGFEDFITFLYERGGRKKLGIECLDIKNLDEPVIMSFLMSKSPSMAGQNRYKKFLMKFRDWISKGKWGRVIHPFAYIEEREEAKPLSVSLEGRHGRLLTEAEIDATFGAVTGMKRPANEYYGIFLRLLLVTGLRSVHALELRAGDVLKSAHTTDDALGRVFHRIRLWETVKKAKEAEREWIPKVKPVVENIYIPPELQKMIEAYIVNYKLNAKDKLIPVTRNGVHRTMTLLSEKTKIPDLTATCFRNTYASIIYACTGWDADAVMLHGGWREPKTILDHYRNVVDPGEALKLLKKYGIRVDAKYADRLKSIEVGLKPLTDEEEERELTDLRSEQKKLREEMEAMKKERELYIKILKERGLL